MSHSVVPGEDALIIALAQQLPAVRQTHLSIGDDAAAIPMPGGDLLLVTTDLLMEDVHFRATWGTPADLGWKALAQNLSDIAAMGGVPTHAVIALGYSERWAPEMAVALYQGIGALAAQAGVDVVGGDTIKSSGPVTLGITVLGRSEPNALVTRAGAQPGDAIYVTGTLGAAALGVRLLDAPVVAPSALAPLIAAQLRPTPRLAAGRALGLSGCVSAMMDLSDGVATDLHRLCRASRTGALVNLDTLPVHPAAQAGCDWLATHTDLSCDPLLLALTGGEDFELLITAAPDREAAVRAAIAPLALTRIGTILPDPELWLLHDNQREPLPWGFTHF